MTQQNICPKCGNKMSRKLMPDTFAGPSNRHHQVPVMMCLNCNINSKN